MTSAMSRVQCFSFRAELNYKSWLSVTVWVTIWSQIMKTPN